MVKKVLVAHNFLPHMQEANCLQQSFSWSSSVSSVKCWDSTL